MSPKILKFLPKFKNSLLLFVENSFVVSLSAFLGTTMLVAYYFGMVSLISIIANIVIVPLSTFIIAGGFLYLFASYLVPFLVKYLALSLDFVIFVLIWVTEIFSNVPFSYFYVDKFRLSIVLIYYIAIILLFNFGYLRAFLRVK